MEIIKILVNVIISLALMIALVICASKLFVSYTEAQIWNEMNVAERTVLQIADNDQYTQLFKSYTFISSLPFIGETL